MAVLYGIYFAENSVIDLIIFNGLIEWEKVIGSDCSYPHFAVCHGSLMYEIVTEILGFQPPCLSRVRHLPN